MTEIHRRAGMSEEAYKDVSLEGMKTVQILVTTKAGLQMENGDGEVLLY